jgi:hypothetical protein
MTRTPGYIEPERLTEIRERIETTSPFTGLFDDVKWLLERLDAREAYVVTLEEKLNAVYNHASPTDGDLIVACDEIRGIIVCPGDEPLHEHGDGCPYCDVHA